MIFLKEKMGSIGKIMNQFSVWPKQTTNMTSRKID